MLPRDCAPLPRILRDNGYSTAAFGKWHLTPDGQQGPAGPFDRWPNGWGFDYFYGFLGGGSGQWDPCLAENQKIIGTPAEYYDEDNPYYLPDAMADKTIEWLHGVRGAGRGQAVLRLLLHRLQPCPAPRRPSWADKYKGKFDQGWDRLREETFARQKELGVVPAGRGADAARRGLPRLGRRPRQAARRTTRARWRSTPATPRTPTTTSAGSSTRSRSSASSTTRW